MRIFSVRFLEEYSERFARARVLFALFFLVFAALILRLYYLQCIRAPRFRDLSRSQHLTSLVLPAKRGSIRDVRGKLLAVSVKRDSVYVDPAMIPQSKVKDTAQRLAAILEMDAGELHARIVEALEADKRFIWVVRKVDASRSTRISEASMPGVGLVSEYKRVYTQGRAACHVLGFVGVDNDGLSGIELMYDEQLRGTDGIRHIERDGVGNTLFSGESGMVSPVPGFDVELTIDAFTQHIVENVLAEIQEKYEPVSASIVVMNPRTGAILAMANRPGFDPNHFTVFTEDEYRNRAVTDCYELGSVMKPFTVCAAMEADLVTPETKVYCESGLYRIGKRLLRDHRSYGWLTVADVIRRSSNIGAAKIGQMCGQELLNGAIRSFGFGGKTGVDLPGEADGIVTPLAKWTDYTTVSVAMGQEIAVTPIQMVCAFSAIANGGVRMKPYVISRIMNSRGGIIKQFVPQVVERAVSDRVAAGKMVPMLSDVVERGTGKRARSELYTLAGKTGTGQKLEEGGGYSHSKFISSFCAFGPAEDPQVCVLVMVNETAKGKPYYGGIVAAPIAGEILEETLKYMGVPQSKSNDRRLANADW